VSSNNRNFNFTGIKTHYFCLCKEEDSWVLIANNTHHSKPMTLTKLSSDSYKATEDQIMSAYHKSISSNNIKHSDTHEFLGIKGSRFLENLSCDWHRGVHRITDYIHNCFRTTFSYSFRECPHNPSINVKQIIPRHPWFPRNTSRYNH